MILKKNSRVEFVTKSAKQTLNLGKRVAASLLGGEILALVGELGSGKTTFVQGLAQGLGIKRRVISPTFILTRRYPLRFKNKDLRIKNFYHLDLYRLEGNMEREIQNLGLSEIWEKKENIIAIEWAEKIRNVVPKNTTWIYFEELDRDSRMIKVQKENL